MAPAIPEVFAPFLSVERTVVFSVSSFSVMYFVYGIYVLLFGIYLYVMCNNERKPDDITTSSRLYLSLATALFVLSTMSVVIYTVFHAQDSINFFDTVKTRDYEAFVIYMSPVDNPRRVALIGLGDLVLVLLYITADWMLIHRCYTIWSSDKRIGLPLMIISIIIHGLGLCGVVVVLVGLVKAEDAGALYSQGRTLYATYQMCSVVFNFILTLLTAGRIWWIHRQLRAHSVHASDKLVQSVCRIILESGLIFPVLQVVALVAVNTSKIMSVPFDFAPIATLSAGVAPTLIMVRAKLGKTVESLQTRDAVSDIRFDSQHRATTTSIQAQSLNMALSDVANESREKDKAVSV